MSHAMLNHYKLCPYWQNSVIQSDGYGPAKHGCPFRDFAEKEIVEKFYIQYGSPLLISLKS